jgi:hypothetical protein
MPGESEAWEATDRLRFSVDEETERVIGVSGSFLANETGAYMWCIGDGNTSWELAIDGRTRSLGDDNCIFVKLIEGYRYGFRAMTVEPTARAFVDLVVQSPSSGGLEPITDYDCETAEVKGCVEGGMTRASGCVVGSSPAPRASPAVCGASGLLNTVHSMGESENWQMTRQSYVSTTGDKVMGLSGSFLCEANGTHVFSIYAQNSTIWQFVSEDFVSVDSFGSDSFEVDMTSGYRYGFRFLTTIAGAGALNVTVNLPDGSRTGLAQYSETCEVNGCVSLNATRDESCVVVPARPNTARPSADATNEEGDPGDSQEGSSTNVGMIVGIVFAVVAVIAILVIVVIVWRKNRDRAKIEDGDEEKGEESENEDLKPDNSMDEFVEPKTEQLEPENEAVPDPDSKEAEPEKEVPHKPEETPQLKKDGRPQEPEERPQLPEELHAEMMGAVPNHGLEEAGALDEAMAGSAGNGPEIPEPDMFEDLCTILRVNRR